MIYAHSLPGQSIEKGEPLLAHLAAVGKHAAASARVFGWASIAEVAGRLHDIGKCSVRFQAYIRGERPSGGDHSSAGAHVALNTYRGSSLVFARLLAFAIAGHHAGLADGSELDDRLKATPLDAPGWQDHTAPLPEGKALLPSRGLQPQADPGFTKAFLVRMLFSCLVDADFLETEHFYAKAKGDPVEPGGHRDLATLRDTLRAYMAEKRAEAAMTQLNALRAEVLDHALDKAALAPGAFTLTVPTGGGKTLTSLSFALEHGVWHGLRRVVYVIPYTSIIEQTAAVFRKALCTDDDVLEHHASFDWEDAKAAREDDGEGRDGLAKLRRAAENWDVPVVVTTAVQFFESLYANRTSRCRKLHNLANSVIVLDEAQTLPINLLRPCVAALKELSANYGASVVLCTATQPALLAKDGFEKGFAIDDSRELAPQPKALYERLKRVQVEHLPGETTDEAIAARFGEREQMLCIVNSRAHARALFERIRHLPGAVHLTTLMCARHRRKVLAEVRRRLERGEPARVVSTSLIEAGVDIDFPEVWRAVTGLDSIAQAAGRCNREGRAKLGRTVVFQPAGQKPAKELTMPVQAARTILRDHPDPLTLDAVYAYFRELYWQKGGGPAFDLGRLNGDDWPILPAIAERDKEVTYPFDSIAAAFHMIDTVMDTVVVPWDDNAKAVLNKIAAMDRPLRGDLRRLQQYTVP
ncbi:MAG: CRISPR-associated helicase Cas3', partial [Alphaproteobacteria bacterium]|nr:CRISPR-associated helicase Cas3' [Alphaproteobacteria bacterium]MBV9861456.1 CRISPR-associated helicase Cas3' [Alphaproteobacteria bacterium]